LADVPNRFTQIRIKAKAQEAFPVSTHSVRCDGDDSDIGKRFIGVKMPEYFNAVHSRQRDIEQNDVRFPVFDRGQRFFPALVFHDGIEVFKHCTQNQPVFGIVIDDRDRSIDLSHHVHILMKFTGAGPPLAENASPLRMGCA